VASSQNAGGAKLLQLADGVSSAIVAGQFMKVFQDELDSMKAEEAVYCALHEQGEYPTIQHHYKILGFPFSQYSCSMEAQMVVNLLTALLSEADEFPIVIGFQEPVYEKVCTLCLGILPSYSVSATGHEILKTWGCNSYEDQRHITSLAGNECNMLIRVCVTLLSR
jgi:hypothetical protein